MHSDAPPMVPVVSFADVQLVISELDRLVIETVEYFEPIYNNSNIFQFLSIRATVYQQ